MGGKCVVDTNVITKLLRSGARAEELFKHADEIYDLISFDGHFEK